MSESPGLQKEGEEQGKGCRPIFAGRREKKGESPPRSEAERRNGKKCGFSGEKKKPFGLGGGVFGMGTRGRMCPASEQGERGDKFFWTSTKTTKRGQPDHRLGGGVKRGRAAPRRKKTVSLRATARG